MREKWKRYPRDAKYLVSNMGNVIGTLKGGNTMVSLSPYMSNCGYITYKISIDGKPVSKTAQRMVAEMWIPNPNGLSDVNHIDEDKTNNCVDNLEWLSHKDNVNYGTRNERVSNKVKSMWDNFKEGDH